MQRLVLFLFGAIALFAFSADGTGAQTSQPPLQIDQQEPSLGEQDRKECEKQVGQDRERLLICTADRLAARQAARMSLGSEFYRYAAIRGLIEITILAAVVSIFGMVVLKLFGPRVPILRLWSICFFPLWSIFIFYGVALFVITWFGFDVSLTGYAILSVVALLSSIWLTVRTFNRVKQIEPSTRPLP